MQNKKPVILNDIINNQAIVVKNENKSEISEKKENKSEKLEKKEKKIEIIEKNEKKELTSFIKEMRQKVIF